MKESDYAALRAKGATIHYNGKHVCVRLAGGQTFRFHQGSRETKRDVHRLRRALRAAEQQPQEVDQVDTVAVRESDQNRDTRSVSARVGYAPRPKCAVPGCEEPAVLRTGLCSKIHGKVTQWAERRGVLQGPEDALAAYELWREAREDHIADGSRAPRQATRLPKVIGVAERGLVQERLLSFLASQSGTYGQSFSCGFTQRSLSDAVGTHGRTSYLLLSLLCDRRVLERDTGGNSAHYRLGHQADLREDVAEVVGRAMTESMEWWGDDASQVVVEPGGATPTVLAGATDALRKRIAGVEAQMNEVREKAAREVHEKIAALEAQMRAVREEADRALRERIAALEAEVAATQADLDVLDAAKTILGKLEHGV